MFEYCAHSLKAKPPETSHPALKNFKQGRFSDGIGKNVFQKTKDDNKLGTSVEDSQFISLMNCNMLKNNNGYWEAPLPLKRPRVPLPNNKTQAYNRLQSTLRTLQKKPPMKKHYFEFMGNIFKEGHAEIVFEEQEFGIFPILVCITLKSQTK